MERTDDGPSGVPSRRRVFFVLLPLLGVMLIAGAGWVWRRAASPYIGTSQRVALEGECGNGIFWRDPDTGTSWWAGSGPRAAGPLDTEAPSGDSSLPRRHADGTLRFLTRNHATFTSDAGGSLTLTRQPKDRFYDASCSLTGP